MYIYTHNFMPNMHIKKMPVEKVINFTEEGGESTDKILSILRCK